MKRQLPEIKFKNQENPGSYFDIVKIEELLQKDLDHNISKNHLIKFYIILFIYEGQGYHTIDFIDYSYKKGTVLMVRKGQIHSFFRSPTVKGYILVFTEEYIISHLNRVESLKALQLFNDSLSFPKIEFNNKDEFADFITFVKHLEFEYNIKDDFSVTITRSVLHIMITKLFRIKAKKGHVVERKKYMSQFLAFQKLVEEDCFKSKKVQYYAQKLGFSSKKLNIIVNNVISGTSAKAFIDERTIMQIKRLLISTDLTINEIAYTVGFSDPTNFYKYFKKFTGIPPDTFRKTH